MVAQVYVYPFEARLHSFMLKHPKYALREFVAVMDAFAPDIILTEVRPDHPGPSEASVDGGIEQSLVYAFGAEKSVPVIPVDWFDDSYFADGEKPMSEQRQLLAEYQQSVRDDSFADLHTEKTQNLVRRIYELDEKRGRCLSRKRNEKICENIAMALKERTNQRFLVIFGLDHKYFIEDYLKMQGIVILAAPKYPQSFKVPDSLKTTAIKNINASQALLERRLKDGFYKGAMREKLAEKLKTYSNWIEAVSLL